MWGTTRPVARFPRLAGDVRAAVLGEGATPTSRRVPPDARDALFPATAVAAGSPVTAWTQVAPGGTSPDELEVALATPAAPGVPEPVPASRGRVLDGLAGGADGTLVVLTAATPPRIGARVHVRRPDGVWEAALDVPEARTAAAAPDGTVALLVVGDDLRLRVRTPDGAWGPAAVVRRTRRALVEPRIVAGPDGTFTVAWTEAGGRERALLTATLPPGGRPGRPHVRSPRVYGHTLTADARGATLAWGEAAGIRVSRRVGASGWSAPRLAPGTGPLCLGVAPDAAAAAPDGSVTVAWHALGAVHAATVRPDGSPGRAVPVARTVGAVTWIGAASDGTGLTGLAWTHAGRVDRRGQLIERLSASVARDGGRERAGVTRATRPQVRSLRVTAGPGGRLRVRLVLRRAGTVQVRARLVQGPTAVAGVPVRARGRAGTTRLDLVAPPALRGRVVWVEVAPVAQPTCAVETRVRTFR